MLLPLELSLARGNSTSRNFAHLRLFQEGVTDVTSVILWLVCQENYLAF